VNGSGDLYVGPQKRTSKKRLAGSFTDIDGATALHGVACTSTTSCVAVDGEGNVIGLAIKRKRRSDGHQARYRRSKQPDGCRLPSRRCLRLRLTAKVTSSCRAAAARAGTSSTHSAATLRASLAHQTNSVLPRTPKAYDGVYPASVPLSHTQTIDSGNSVNALSCIPGTTECVAVDSKGNALYTTEATATSSSTWNHGLV